MKSNIDDNGRECTWCGQYKSWDLYGKHRKGTNGKQSLCLDCRKIETSINKYGAPDMSKKRGINPDILMDNIRRRLHHKKFLELRQVFKSSGIQYRKCRECRKCKNSKENSEFLYIGKGVKGSNPYSHHCNKCREGLSVDDYAKKRHKRWDRSKKRDDIILNQLKGANESNIDNGFVYLYWSDELNCFKIGRTKYSPFVYIAGKSKEYGLDLKMVAFIICPIRDVDIERYVFRSIKSVRVEHIKPCGGNARELFRCDLHDVIRVFKSITDSIYIEPNPFLNEDDIGVTALTKEQLIEVCAKKRKKYRPKESVLINRMFKANKPKHLRDWNLFKSMKYSAMRCYATGDRDDALFEAVFNKSGQCISLGLFGSYEDARNSHKEFKELLTKERCFRDRKLSRLRSGVRSPRVKRFLASQN